MWFKYRAPFLWGILLFDSYAGMYNNVEAQPAAPKPPASSQPNPFGNAFYGAGSGLIRGGLGAYGEKIFGSSSEYVQSNVSTISYVNLSPTKISILLLLLFLFL